MVYQLVAWTDKGQVKLLPELLREYAQPYMDRIESLQAFYDEGWDDELGRLTEQDVLALSRSYEAYGRFLRAHGKRHEAFEAFTDAAAVCLDERFKEMEAPFAEERKLVQRECRANRAYYFGRG